MIIKRIPLPQKRYWPWIIFTGATQIAFCNAAMQTSLQTLGAGLAAMLNYTMPIWVAILARVFLQEKLSGRKVAGIVLSISGLGLLLNVDTSGDWYAIMLALSAAMVWAAGNVAMKGKLMGCDLTSLTAWQMTIGAVVLAVYNVFIGDWYAEWRIDDSHRRKNTRAVCKGNGCMRNIVPYRGCEITHPFLYARGGTAAFFNNSKLTC